MRAKERTPAQRGASSAGARGRRTGPPADRRERVLRRALPIAALALVAFIVGVVVGAGGSDAGRGAVTAYAKAWSTGDWATMHS